MRCSSTVGGALLTAFCLTASTATAFVFKAPVRNTVASANRRCAKCVVVSGASRSGFMTKGSSNGGDASPSWGTGPRLSVGVPVRGTRNDGQWEPMNTNLADGPTPEELMRQMSIPALAQKLEKIESKFGAVHPQSKDLNSVLGDNSEERIVFPRDRGELLHAKISLTLTVAIVGARIQVASALIPLAQALYANGDLAPARETCTRALKILQAAFGNTPSVEVAECLHTLAMIQQAESPQVGDKAMTSQNMALELAMRVCGPTSIEVAAYSRCLAQMSEEYARYLKPGLPRPFYMPHPVPLYRQTLNILEKIMGPNHPEVATAIDDLASALLFWRDDEFSDEKAASFLPEAEALAARSLEISRAALGQDDPITAGREHNLGMVKRGLGREEDAREYFRRALNIREKSLGPEDPLTKGSRQLLEEEPPAEFDLTEATPEAKQ